MINRIRFYLALVMFCYSIPSISETRNQHYETFCLYTKLTLGRTQCSFLRRSAVTQTPLFYWAIWTGDYQVEKCYISADTVLIQKYMKSCREDRTWHSNLTRVNISVLLEPNNPCKFGQLDGVDNFLLNRTNLNLGHQVVGKTRQKRSWILPGTLWCGRGSSAGYYEQLGMFKHADGCCREHDHCSHVIRPFTVNFGVFNPSLFTISHCNCDQRFKQCLLNVNDSVSNMVGYSFFNILKLRCFDLIQKRRCTQLNWFGMCTSVKVAPFAILKNPISYTFNNSNPGTSDIYNPPNYEIHLSANGKNIKPKQRRKLSNGQMSNDTIATRGDVFLLNQKTQRYGKTKTLSSRTTTFPPLWEITTQPSLPTVHNSTFLHQKNQAKKKLRTSSVHQSELMNHSTPPPGSAKNNPIHTTLSRAKGFSAQKPFGTPLKKIHINRTNTTKYRRQNITVNMIQNQKTQTSCDSTVPSMDYNFQSTQQKGKDRMADKATKLKSLHVTGSPNLLKTSLTSLFPRTKNLFVNKTQLMKKTSFPNRTNVHNKNTSENLNQKIKHSCSKNKLTTANKLMTNIIKEPKTKNSTPGQLLPTTAPKSMLRKDIILSPWVSVRFKDPTSKKQGTLCLAMKNAKKKCKAPYTTFKVNNASERMTTTSRSLTPKQKSTHVPKKKMTSSPETKKTPSFSLWNETKSTFKETGSPSICDAVRYLDDCKYRIQAMETIYGHHSNKSTTIYHCDCLYSLIDGLKQHKKEQRTILEFLFRNCVSLSCIKIPDLKECNKAIGCPVILSKTTEQDSSLTNMDKNQITLKNIKQFANKRAPGKLYKHCLRILNHRNPKHVKKS